MPRQPGAAPGAWLGPLCMRCTPGTWQVWFVPVAINEEHHSDV